jgi:hypothetical protein
MRVMTCLVVAAATTVLAACGADGDGSYTTKVEVASGGCDPKQRARGLRPYSVGSEFAGMPLTAVLEECRRERRTKVTYIYGECELPPGEGGCAPPLAIQVWQPCARRYDQYAPGARPALSRRRGVAVGLSDGQMDVYTDSTVVVFTTGSGSVGERAVAALRPLPRGSGPRAVGGNGDIQTAKLAAPPRCAVGA